MKKHTLAFLAVGLLGLVGSCESAPTCNDGLKNGTEGDVDCGATCSTLCADKAGCGIAGDCLSGVCFGGQCQVPSCQDGVKNGMELAIDCGGPCQTKCSDNAPCLVAADCQSGVCSSGVCAVPTCTDGVKNAQEGDVDCGGSCPTLCKDGSSCNIPSDCQSVVCSGGFCAIPTCSDSAKNAMETDVDCGGGTCSVCADGKGCKIPGDCQSNVCMSNTCIASSCSDTVKNGTETDIDCGGASCLKCADLKSCLVGTDCQSKICNASKQCAVPTCSDVTMNGKETDIDCGGGACAPCADLKGCAVGSDCASGVCSAAKTCSVPTCSDTVKNGTETDIDCGGSCTAKCAVMKACLVDADCASSTCFNKTCVNTPTFTSITPNMGPTTGNTPVILNGTNFFPVGGAATSVTFGGTASASPPTIAAATMAAVNTPARLNQVGLVNVVLTLQGNHAYTLTNGFRYYYGTLGWNATATGGTLAYTGTAAADFDGDGDIDLAAARAGNVDILLNNGAGVFAAPVAYAVGTNPVRLATADFNGDGKMDIAVSQTNGQVVVMFNSGTATFPTRTPYTITGATNLDGIIAVDVDGVNKADILVANRGANSIAYLKNGGAGTFTLVSASFVTGITTAHWMANGDFNKDGRPDFVVSSNSTLNAYSCINMAGTSYTCTANTSTGPTADVAVADVNNDTFPDFVVSHVGGNNVFAYLGDGAGNFSQMASNNIAGTWTNFQLADINKDGYIDLVYGSNANAVGVCLGKNDGTFAAAAATRATTSPVNFVSLGQFNAGTDQKDDFAAATNAGVQYALSSAQ